MTYKVQLPDYPCYHLVTGFTEGRGASGRKLLLAQAQFVREGLRPSDVRDLSTLMLLHDAVRIRQVGDYQTNKPALYGRTRELQLRASTRIAGATVEVIA
jgi:hypothetical protein